MIMHACTLVQILYAINVMGLSDDASVTYVTHTRLSLEC